MKIVKFKDDSYGVRKLSIKGYVFLDGGGDWGRYSKRPAGRTLKQCNELVNLRKSMDITQKKNRDYLNDVGIPIKRLEE